MRSSHTKSRTGTTSAPASAAPDLPDIGIYKWQPQLYTLGHLELLHNLSSNVFVDTDILLLPLPICKVIMQHALSTPYLMDQILALSASHMSFVRPNHGHRKAYRNQAMLLQTRALTAFNSAGVGISAQNGCSWFLYASLLGLQVMFETFQSHSFEGFLGQLSTYLAVHRGVLAVIRQTWCAVKDFVDQIIQHCSYSWLGGGLRLEDGQPRECGVLTSLITQSHHLEAAEREACQEASEKLQWLFDLYRNEPRISTQIHFTIAWTITMPAVYAEMLQNRRPEALVIFAFYAVLLDPTLENHGRAG
ncbi:hypothetical protein ESCO_005816 [Escovopsis weberi]|uniref:Uncharacterized protein n=1 Tax=Escovopsis weberi TaxID=150374 RepID=A0A0M8N3R8_ESCWE|nr:hypothetical protein ESCO_005816 [Escovopsis weberi]